MRRLFRKWDTDHHRKLSLQNMVNGFAAVKGTRDIMTNIAYFFDLYDDEGDGKVDRDGILKMSEALLFLGRRGLPDNGTSNVATPVNSPRTDGNGNIRPAQTKEEQFLSAVSAFIRRCFEYADPDGLNNAANKTAEEARISEQMSAFAIGDDDEDEDDKDLINFDSSSPTQREILNLPPVPSETKPHTHAANIALDPAHPLFITLATFRMVILADETLESFFDTGFANTFHLADQPIPSSASSLSNLTTFANLGLRNVVASAGSAAAAAPAGLANSSRGLKGMLDGIVTDGMRVATEVRRRMEDIQKELDTASVPRGQDDDDEEEDEKAGDDDLLDTAEASAMGDNVNLNVGKKPERTLSSSSGKSGEGLIEFEI
jgi:TBC1 domain family member 8/9